MKSIFNIPNLLTLIRLILSGFIFYFIFIGNNNLALILFVIAALTEFDGTIARKLKQETVFGKHFDGITDIFWMGGVFLAFIITGKIPLWVVYVALFFIITVGTSVLVIAKKTKKPIDVSFHRKTDLVSGFFILAYLISLFLEFSYSYILVILAIITSIISSFNYWKKAIK